MRNSKKIFIAVFLTVIAISGHFFILKKNSENNLFSLISVTPGTDIIDDKETDGFKTFIFDNFHGIIDISEKFKFEYPSNWYNDGYYFSPQKIQYYNKFNVKAPIYFDLILAEIFHLTELQYQIDNSKRRNPDTVGELDGKEFKKYDLIDYGSYGGDSAGRVKIFVGPEITIDGQDYILVFHWEEHPLAEYVQGNDVNVFDNMLLTLRFFK